ncbi:sugar transferase [Rhizobium grahamii]|uniref:Sugar transferase n=2 Tax=Rhizobium grahamii TaxID=1120045 RepID=A0A5Q0C7N4_9HYPH|nr:MULTISPECIES: sugar transferase [Rhizobium]QFY59990.1 sugar transferase [Rhizobium grahamii]QRM50891.1 sugar transferase [Rhizobium sp. BG6]
MSGFNLSRDFDRLDEAQVHGEARGPSRAGPSRMKGIAGGVKCGLDIFLASAGLIVLSPMILMVIAILLVLQGRPIFIAHPRIGRRGAVFPCLKFRTMVPDAADVLTRYLAANPRERAEWKATRKLKNDPRITPFGAFLRRSSVDEIPQLFNVIRGQMSLVGPRPIVASEAELYGSHFSDYIRVRPGLTGLWQISGRSDTSYSARVELDVRYVTEHTVWGDVVIMARTIPAVLRSRGSY